MFEPRCRDVRRRRAAAAAAATYTAQPLLQPARGGADRAHTRPHAPVAPVLSVQRLQWKRRMRLLVRLLMLLAASGDLRPAAAQPSAAVCCFAGGQISYVRMPVCELQAGQRGVSEWLDLRACWEAVEAHFGNRTTQTTPQGLNVTIAERYPIFVINLAAGAAIATPADAPALALDSSLLPPGAIPVDGPMRGFGIVFSFPYDEQTRTCKPASLTGLTLAVTDVQNLQPQGLGVQFAGCGREVHKLHNLTLTSIGWGSPSFEFLSVVGSDILTVEAPWSEDHQDTEAALSFIEADIISSNVSYFGDVSGNFGDSFGATQNGSRALRSTFVAVDPTRPDIYGPTYTFRKPSSNNNYDFSWCVQTLLAPCPSLKAMLLVHIAGTAASGTALSFTLQIQAFSISATLSASPHTPFLVSQLSTTSTCHILRCTACMVGGQ